MSEQRVSSERLWRDLRAARANLAAWEPTVRAAVALASYPAFDPRLQTAAEFWRAVNALGDTVYALPPEHRPEVKP